MTADTQKRPCSPAWRTEANLPSTWFDTGFVRAEAWLSARRNWVAVVIMAMVVQAWLVLSHVAWFDEWQALLIAVRSPDIASLLDQLRYEGHPPLWYIFLRLAAKVLPENTLALVQLPIALGIQALILHRAPFGRAERLLIICSAFILFEFGVIARSLALGALMCIAFFASRGRLIPWLLTILLPLVDFQFGVLSIGLLAILIQDSRWSTPGALLWLISALLAGWTVLPAPDAVAATHLSALPAVAKFVDDLSPLLIPLQTQNDHLAWSGGLPWRMGWIAGILFVVFACRQTEAVALHKWFFRSVLLTYFLFSITVYSLSVRHLTLLALLLILLKWREYQASHRLNREFRLWLLVIALGGLCMASISASRPFDGSAQAAHFIATKGLADKNWVTWRPERGTTTGALLGRDMAMLDGQCVHSFVHWNFHDRIQTRDALLEAARRYAAVYGRVYLITSLDPRTVDDPLLKPLSSFTNAYNGYRYDLYIVAPEQKESLHRPPPCKQTPRTGSSRQEIFTSRALSWAGLMNPD